MPVYHYCLPRSASPCRFGTYTTHPWLFRCAATGERLLAGGTTAFFATGGAKVEVTRRPPLLHSVRGPLGAP